MPYLLAMLLMLAPNAAGAAELMLTPAPSIIGVGDVVRVTVAVASDVPVNAFSGALRYPPGMEPIGQDDGNSIVTLWVERPAAADNAIRFTGIVPGGYSGERGKLFAATFRATSAGDAVFTLDDIRVLANDGAGTPEPVVRAPLALVVAQESVESYAEPEDYEPPEPFTPVLGRDPGLFAGREYAAFMTADKGSGIDRYEVAETRLPYLIAPLSFTRAESPHVLRDQVGTSDMYIKAIDRAGNERIEVISRRDLLRPYEWAVLVLVLIGAFLYARFRLFP